MDWLQIAPGVWRAVVGDPEEVTPLALVEVAPSLEALRALGERSLPPAGEAAVGEIAGGSGRSTSRTVVRLPLTEAERLFGLGLQFMKVNQRGRPRYLRVNSDPRQDTGETHAPVPFLVSSRGHGLLVNTSRSGR